MDEFEANAPPKTGSYDHCNGSQGLDRPPLSSNYFGNVLIRNSNFDNRSLLSIDNLNVDRVGLIDQILNQVSDKIFHSLLYTSQGASTAPFIQWFPYQLG